MAYISTEPIFLINGFLCMLYPLSNIIGGSSIIMNNCTKFYDIFSSVDSIFINFNAKPVIIPTKVVRLASWTYLCPDFFN